MCSKSFALVIFLSILVQSSSEDVYKRCALISDYFAATRNTRNYTSTRNTCSFGEELEFACCPKNELLSFPNRRTCEEKCEEYSSYVYTKVNVLSSTNKLYLLNSCDLKPKLFTHETETLYENIDPRIYVPQERSVEIREFPHVAALGIFVDPETIVWTCTGALISEFYVLTAAHCFYHTTKGQIKFVRLGVHMLDVIMDNEYSIPEDYDIEKIIPHPEFQMGLFYDDIGLVKMSKKVKFSPFIRPACLATDFDGPEKKTISLAYRELWFGDEVITSTLYYNSVDKIPFDDCRTSYNTTVNLTRGIDTEKHICIALKNEKAAAKCRNESFDGVLQVFHKSKYCMYSITGIKVHGVWCSTVSRPSIYTRVYPYLEWIENIVWG